ncbi:uncharacterized protein LOC117216344 [Bombus bifarius]|uniref:Uncharacterized protein LOC117216344 n=1 Tax=Bombus bifarius TaxID=103933 RepID=A0A6P8NX97_9HYME|nr:uncharacterized protein LOC117216344 [Bombus bifarius]
MICHLLCVDEITDRRRIDVSRTRCLMATTRLSLYCIYFAGPIRRSICDTVVSRATVRDTAYVFLVLKDVTPRNKLIRGRFSSRTTEWPVSGTGEKARRVELPTCIHIWNSSGWNPAVSLWTILIGNFLRPSEGQGIVRVGITSVWIARNTL